MMSVFKGPGILLNPIAVKRPVELPRLFRDAVASAKTNACALTDELGAIAHDLHISGHSAESQELFGILESGYKLVEKQDVIAGHLACLEPLNVARSLIRSCRFSKEHRDMYNVPAEGRGGAGRPKLSDAIVAAAIELSGYIAAAAPLLGLERSGLFHRVMRAPEGMLLAAYKDYTFERFMRRWSRIVRCSGKGGICSC